MSQSVWTKEEQKWLVQIVESCEQMKQQVDWNEVSKQLNGKSKSQCQVRYLKLKNSNVSDSERYHEWTQAEKDILMDCVNIYGKDWERISRKFFTWMTPLKLKNKHYAITKVLPDREAKKLLAANMSKESSQKSSSEVDEEDVYQKLRELLGC
ncbi:Myb-like_DNA-binding domain-containing protein [Hexamita inflata]|uniref:Myb-like DNA-binding domain-containing protein n=1 Tax=Hexamita inflata TaxID=28002 RepID=A0AA86N6P6_9EUKA|nr:Myb-like DNA-binding domain-containing protein [Hexamita inflata]CAI9978009.1 Myb-like DNA-binding domain-containing protein [Hexamita inflata]